MNAKVLQSALMVDAPAKLEGFEREHVIDKRIGIKGWRRIDPAQALWKRKNISKVQRAAWERYASLWDVSAQTGRAPLHEATPSRMCAGLPFTVKQQEAIRKVKNIDRGLSIENLAIVRAVCGQGCWPSEAMQQIFGDAYKHSTMARFSEAMVALVRAMQEAGESV